MARTERSGLSRSLAIYGWLLGLYPAELLKQHHAEMLQNFADLAHTSSKPALWLFMGKDLMTSLYAHYRPKSLRAQTILMIVVLGIVLAALRITTSHHYFVGAVTVCYGFVIGWFAGWLGKRRQVLSPR